jgi:hypothetical protein
VPYCILTNAVRAVEACVATLNVASELASKSIKHGTGMSRKLRVLKASKFVGVSVAFYGWFFRKKSGNGADRSPM